MMRSHSPLSSMELSCVSCSRSLSHLPLSSSSSSSSSVLLRDFKGKGVSIPRCSSGRVRASIEGSGERSINDVARAGGIEVSASGPSAATASTTTAINPSFGGRADELAVWEKLEAVVRLSYGIGEFDVGSLQNN